MISPNPPRPPFGTPSKTLPSGPPGSPLLPFGASPTAPPLAPGQPFGKSATRPPPSPSSKVMPPPPAPPPPPPRPSTPTRPLPTGPPVVSAPVNTPPSLNLSFQDAMPFGLNESLVSGYVILSGVSYMAFEGRKQLPQYEQRLRIAGREDIGGMIGYSPSQCASDVWVFISPGPIRGLQVMHQAGAQPSPPLLLNAEWGFKVEFVLRAGPRSRAEIASRIQSILTDPNAPTTKKFPRLLDEYTRNIDPRFNPNSALVEDVLVVEGGEGYKMKKEPVMSTNKITPAEQTHLQRGVFYSPDRAFLTTAVGAGGYNPADYADRGNATSVVARPEEYRRLDDPYVVRSPSNRRPSHIDTVHEYGPDSPRIRRGPVENERIYYKDESYEYGRAYDTAPSPRTRRVGPFYDHEGRQFFKEEPVRGGRIGPFYDTDGRPYYKEETREASPRLARPASYDREGRPYYKEEMQPTLASPRVLKTGPFYDHEGKPYYKEEITRPRPPLYENDPRGYFKDEVAPGGSRLVGPFYDNEGRQYYKEEVTHRPSGYSSPKYDGVGYGPDVAARDDGYTKGLEIFIPDAELRPDKRRNRKPGIEMRRRGVDDVRNNHYFVTAEY